MTTNKQLRELAEKAGIQEWGQEKGNVVSLGGWPNSSGPLVLASANEHFPEHALNTAAYVSAANPATILALLDAYEAMQAECEKLRKLLAETVEDRDEAEYSLGLDLVERIDSAMELPQ